MEYMYVVYDIHHTHVHCTTYIVRVCMCVCVRAIVYVCMYASLTIHIGVYTYPLL